MFLGVKNGNKLPVRHISPEMVYYKIAWLYLWQENLKLDFD